MICYSTQQVNEVNSIARLWSNPWEGREVIYERE